MNASSVYVYQVVRNELLYNSYYTEILVHYALEIEISVE